MKVSVIRATESPIEVISKAAGTCYGKGDQFSVKRVETCYNSGHLSVFEHVSASIEVEGISRACMAQLTRHRLVSFCVESQRYCKYDMGDDDHDWYVMPESFGDWQESGDALMFDALMSVYAYNYRNAIKKGIKPEDARYLLPEATKTRLVMTANLRELYHIFDMRRAQSAQWEIRELADKIAETLEGVGADWAYLVGLWG